LNKEGRKTGKRFSTPSLPSCIPAFLIKNSKDQNLNEESRKKGKRFSTPPIPSCIPAFLIKKPKRPGFE
jgi:hypothetical protein